MDSAKEDDGHIGYDLRENPKKSWKFSSFNRAASCSASASASMQESQCKVCGKDFESLKALYGHMRHHPRRERKRIQCKECGKSLLSAKSLSNHMRVHSQKLRVSNESEAVKGLVVKRKRSERKRYNFNASSSISSLNECLSVTEIDQHLEQGAVCLMMLSRGVHNWGEFYAFSEFSDNDSVAFGVKSLNKKKRVLTNGGGCFVSIGNECLMKKPRLEKLDSIVLYEKEEEEECNEIDSGAESDEGKKVKLEVSIEKFYEDGEFEMPKLDDKPGPESSEAEIEKESSQDLMEGDGLNEAEMGIMTSTSSKKVRFNASIAEFEVDITSDYGILVDSQKVSEIKGETCNKIFSSRGALGGHQRMHGTKRSSMSVKTRKSEKQNKTTMFPEAEAGSKLVKLECIENLMEKENKEHKCRICLKAFATGQALGGHQRAHLGKNSDTILQDIAVEQDYYDVSNDLDLNVSNMLEEETDGDARSEQWFVDGEPHKHEPLVSLVAN